jgi:hypothetical protein
MQSSGTATATFTGTTIGVGHANAVVDNFAVTSNNIVVNATTITTGADATASESNQTVSLSANITSGGGTIGPVTMLAVDPTLIVNKFDDPAPTSPIANACTGGAASCSLGEAVLRANADSPTTSPTDSSGNPAPALPFTVSSTCVGDVLSNATCCRK